MDKVILYTDGGSRGNPGPSALAYRITDTSGEILAQHSEFIGESTNNIAEYQSLIAGLGACLEFTDEVVEHFSDSQLLVNQCNLEWKIKQEHLKALYYKVLSASRKFNLVEHNWLKRDDPRIESVDSLVNVALDSQ